MSVWMLSVVVLLIIAVKTIQSATPNCSTLPISSNEYFGLYDLYNSSNGEFWNWKTNETIWNFTGFQGSSNENKLLQPCGANWQGVGCQVRVISRTKNIYQCFVQSLELPRYRLSGYISSTISFLSNLKTLNLAHNKIGETIPQTIWTNFVDLQVVDLSDNLLTGSIPGLLFVNKNLLFLDLSFNSLDGMLPSNFSSTNLLTLELSTNSLSGTIPENLRNLHQLISLSLSFNHFLGSIPDIFDQIPNLQFLGMGFNFFRAPLSCSITTLANLEFLDLGFNRLFGSIPECIGNLTSLKYLDVFSNFLTGPIPSQMGRLRNLKYLELSHNQLTGLPSSIGLLDNLTEFNLNQNKILGPLPPELGLLANLEVCDLEHNYFSGSIPISIINMSSLLFFIASHNRLIGTIKTELVQLPNLIQLNLDSNSLSGTIPTILAQFPSLRLIALSNNNFHGTIPLELSGMSKLTSFECQYCNLSGSLPPTFGVPEVFSRLMVGGNSLTGPIPPTFGNMTKCYALFLFDNLLTSYIPSSIGNVNCDLDYLTLYGNRFSGPIPTSLSLCTSLLTLELEENYFSQSIPSELGNLRRLLGLSVYSNLLEFTLPPKLANMIELQEMFLGNNFFTGSVPATWTQQMRQLEKIDLSGNLLSGLLPSFDLSRLNSLDLNGNFLFGPFPNIYLPALTILNMSNNFFSGTIPSILGGIEVLKVIALNQNLFVGSLPSSLGFLSQLTDLVLFGNNIRGVIPSELGLLQNLNLIEIQNNKLVGSIPTALCSCTNLKQLIAMNNSLTGSLPPCLFSLPLLRGISLTSNCFTGSLATCGAINYSSTLVVLDLSDLTSGLNCRRYTLSANFFSGFYSDHYITNGIPSCIWSLPNLQTLFLAGNGLTGSMNVGSFNLSSQLINVSLAYNQLTGTVPASILSYGKFQWFDLSHNRLSGTLSDSVVFNDFHELPDSSWTFSIAVNRFSGRFPPNMNITRQSDPINKLLSDNMFSFPPSLFSQNLESYNGSFPLDVAMIFSSGVAFLFMMLSLFSYYCLTQYQNQSSSSPRIKMIGKLMTQFIGWRCQTLQFIRSKQDGPANVLRELQQVLELASTCFFRFGWVSIMYLTVFIYILKGDSELKSNFSTQSYQYRWRWSTCFLHGHAVVWILAILLILSIVPFLRYFSQIKPFLVRDILETNKRKSIFIFKSSVKIFAFLLSFNFRQTFCGALSSCHYYRYPRCNDMIRNTILAFVIIFDILVMLIINILYLNIVVSNHNIGFYQFLLALFKSIWNAFYVPFTLRGLNFLITQQMSMKLLIYVSWTIYIINNLLAPSIATALTDKNCLLPLFQNEPLPSATFNFKICEEILDPSNRSINICIANYDLNFAQSVNTFPPFIYTYGCASSLVVQYVPVFLYAIIFSGLLQPLFFLLIMNFDASIMSRPVSSLFLLFFPILKWHSKFFDELIDHPDFIKLNQFKLSSGFNPSSNTIDLTPQCSSDQGHTQIIQKPVHPSPDDPQFASRQVGIDHTQYLERKTILRELVVVLIDEAEARVCFLSAMLLSKLAMYCAIFLTFGLASPFLGIIVTIASVLDVEVWFVAIGRFRELIIRTRTDFLLEPLTPPVVSMEPKSSSSSSQKTLYEPGLSHQNFLELGDADDHDLANSERPSISLPTFSKSSTSSSVDVIFPPPSSEKDLGDTEGGNPLHSSISFDFAIDRQISRARSFSTTPFTPKQREQQLLSALYTERRSIDYMFLNMNITNSCSILMIVRTNFWASIWVCIFFWSIHYFDFIGDVDGIRHALRAVLLLVLLVPSIIWTLDLIFDTIQHVSFAHFGKNG